MVRVSREEERVKKIAVSLHHNFGGLTDYDYLHITGEKRRSFEELEQWEQDDLIFMAKMVIVFLKE